MHVRHHRDRDLSNDLAQGVGGRGVHDGKPHDVTPDPFHLQDLGDGRADIARVRLRHCLDADRGVPADDDGTDRHRPGFASANGQGHVREMNRALFQQGSRVFIPRRIINPKC